jgi:lipoprotein-releasing system ATP-binding protein
MNDKIILQCQQLSKRFTQGGLDVEVLKGIDLSVAEGQRIAIMGASGSGKSTLLHLLGGLDNPTSGKVMLDGVDLNKVSQTKLGVLRNRSLGFIYQFHHFLGEITVLETVAMPLLIGGNSVKQAKQSGLKLLKRVGLAHRVDHKPGEISGGERQRAAVARALINQPKCILADEPTGNLDSKTAEQVYQLMLELNAELKVSFLVVTHDADLAARMDTVFYMENGLIA